MADGDADYARDSDSDKDAPQQEHADEPAGHGARVSMQYERLTPEQQHDFGEAIVQALPRFFGQNIREDLLMIKDHIISKLRQRDFDLRGLRDDDTLKTLLNTETDDFVSWLIHCVEDHQPGTEGSTSATDASERGSGSAAPAPGPELPLPSTTQVKIEPKIEHVPPVIAAKRMPRRPLAPRSAAAAAPGAAAVAPERPAHSDDAAGIPPRVKSETKSETPGGYVSRPLQHRSRSPRAGAHVHVREEARGGPDDLSHRLVRVLRHRNDWIEITPEGFVPVNLALQALHGCSYSVDDVRRMVRTSVHSDGAPRFEIQLKMDPFHNGGPEEWIRATRYHSIPTVQANDGHPRAERLSKALSKILRHEAVGMMQPDGFAPLHQIHEALRRFHVTSADVMHVARTSCSGRGSHRFEISEFKNNGTWIRATRKHTISGIHVRRTL